MVLPGELDVLKALPLFFFVLSVTALILCLSGSARKLDMTCAASHEFTIVSMVIGDAFFLS